MRICLRARRPWAPRKDQTMKVFIEPGVLSPESRLNQQVDGWRLPGKMIDPVPRLRTMK